MAEGPDVDLLMLDVNGVLYRYDVDARIESLAQRLGVGASQVETAIFDSGLEDAADAGDIDPETYLHDVGRHLGVPLDPVVWADALADAVEPDEDVLAVIGSVANQVQATTLSNNGLLVRELVDRIYPRLASLPLEFHVAAEFGDSKPDTDVYLDVCERFDARPDRAAFVDDKATNADGARAAGLHAHHFVDVAGLVDFLRGVGLDP